MNVFTNTAHPPGHLRPRGVARLFAAGERFRRIYRSFISAGLRVFLAEFGEFLLRTRFVAPGTLDRVPGYPTNAAREPVLGGAR